jgi:manganese/zinc/iron transport system substrate-binding protein
MVNLLRLALLLVPLSFGLHASGCDRSAASGPSVVATTTMLGDVVSILLDGTAVNVETLIKPGVDPHTYELKANEAKRLQSAGLVIYNGLGLEGTMGQMLRGLPAAIEAGALVPEARRIGAQQFEGAYDPHLWMDVGLWAEHVVQGLADELARRFPEHADRIASNNSAYQAELARLDAYAKQAVALIPEDRRVLVTAHDAFNYFGRAYGIEVRGVQGISTASQAGIKDIEDLTRFIVQSRIPAVFVETSVNTKPVEKLVAGAAAAGHEVKLGAPIYSDSTGPGGTFEGTYLGMIDHNVTVIARALGAPGVDPHGVSGQLTVGHEHSDEESEQQRSANQG